MQLKDAIFKMNPGDRFKTSEPILTNPFTMNKEGLLINVNNERVNFMVDNLILEGEIIPAEPVVLSAEEAWGKRCYPDPNEIKETAYLSGFDDGKEQGRLERDLELRPFVDFVKSLDNPNRYARAILDPTRELLKNLKPLNPHDS